MHGELGRRLGHSDPLAVPEFILEMRRRGHAEALIRKVVYENPLAFFSQCARFQSRPTRPGAGDFSELRPPVTVRADVRRAAS